MARKKKLRAGSGAKCSIMTRFLHPKQIEFANDKQHRSTVTLLSKLRKKVNRKDQDCYMCSKEGLQDQGELYAVASHFKIEEEGPKELLFDPVSESDAEEQPMGVFKEPKVKWKKSEAKRILYHLILDGSVPDHATDEHAA